MRNRRWLLFSAGLLVLLTSSTSGGPGVNKAGRLLRTFQGHSEGVHQVAFSPDGKRLASASDDATVRVWELNTGKQLHTLGGHGKSSVRGVAFSPDGKWLASAGVDQKVVLWDAAAGRKVRT